MKNNQSAFTLRQLLGAAFSLAVYSTACAADWSQSGVNGAVAGQAPGLWAGISGFVTFLYACLWIGALVVIGMGWFKWKGGDHTAGLFHLSGGVGLGVTPFLVQWFRNM